MNSEREAHLIKQVASIRCGEELREFRATLLRQGEQISTDLLRAINEVEKMWGRK